MSDENPKPKEQSTPPVAPTQYMLRAVIGTRHEEASLEEDTPLGDFEGNDTNLLGAIRGGGFIEERAKTEADYRRKLKDHEAAQGVYLSALGSLIQFNAIMTAVCGAALTSTTGILKPASGIALTLHVIAAFLLCWAARPVDGGRAETHALALFNAVQDTHHTFRSYLRGWRATMVAMVASAAVIGLYMYESFVVRPGGFHQLL